MEEKDKWVYFKEIDWDDNKFNQFNIDTRDFHVGYRFEEKRHKDYKKISKYQQRFFNTKDELISIIDRLFNESGGDGEWRYLSLEGCSDWTLKYIRIWRTDIGFIICNSNNIALTKEFLSLPINQEYLGKH